MHLIIVFFDITVIYCMLQNLTANKDRILNTKLPRGAYCSVVSLTVTNHYYCHCMSLKK